MKIDFQRVNRRQSSQQWVRRGKRSRHSISAVCDWRHYITQWALVRAAQLSLARRSLVKSREPSSTSKAAEKRSCGRRTWTSTRVDSRLIWVRQFVNPVTNFGVAPKGPKENLERLHWSWPTGVVSDEQPAVALLLTQKTSMASLQVKGSS